MPALNVTLACLSMPPLAFCSVKLIEPPAAKPLASPDDKPVARMDGALVSKTSLRPKNCEKPVPPRLDGVVASSFPTTPLPPVAEIDSAPLEKLALPLLPSAEFSAVTKLPTVEPMGCAAPPSTDNVPAPKSTSMRLTRLPLESATAIVVLPVKFSASG